MKKLMRETIVVLFAGILFTAAPTTVSNKSEATESILESESKDESNVALEDDSPIDIDLSDKEEVTASYEDVWNVGYVNTKVNVRSNPSLNSEVYETIGSGTSFNYVELNEEWVTIQYNGSYAYICKRYVSEQRECLTKDRGVFYGPSGKETYYNLDMTEVIKRMRRKGYSKEEYPYWVREDGVKMLGDYILIACDFSIRPIGTIVETSLGTGISCDTGNFNGKHSNWIDIAVTW